MLLARGYDVGRHEGKNDPWPYINYLLFILKTAYNDFSSRATMVHPERGEKHARILEAFESLLQSFTLADLIAKCPGISTETVRKAIKELKRDGKVEMLKAGRALHSRIQ